MNSFLEKISLFSGSNTALLKEGLHGLEKECLRVTKNKKLSSKAHPAFLGSPLTHPFFSTDFGEAQLELITPPYSSLKEVYEHLDDLHRYVHQHLSDEWLWPMSAPCALAEDKEIELAKYGFTQQAYQKWLYRKGLSYRYGKNMQLLSGIHYSFSFSKSFWKTYQKGLQSKAKLQDFINDQYLHLIRNFLRMGWICSYLFGSSPIIDKTYLKEKSALLKTLCKDSYYGPYATSIRMSHLGYFSQIQCQKAVSFNKLEEYLQDLQHLLETPSSEFQKIGQYRNQKQIQMNENILQIEAEHYSRIRPKPLEGTMRPLKALSKGIGYVESRILDLNPFHKNGLDEETLHFMHLFLVYCLFKESPPITKSERCEIFQNQNKVALSGRKPGLRLQQSTQQKTVSFKSWAFEILEELQEIAALLDQTENQNPYQRALKTQIKKLDDSKRTPSAQILEKMKSKNQSFIDFSFQLAKSHKKTFISKKLPSKNQAEHKRLVKKSLEELSSLEEKEDFTLAGYEDLEFSTQMLLKEAMRQNIQFEILDRKENFILLKKNGHQEWIKQATQTRLDPLISYFLMENKQVTKVLLQKEGLQVPRGKLYDSVEKALLDYSSFEKSKLVVKPNLTNMGVGISFVEPLKKEAFHHALKVAAKYKHQILVEEFFKGQEYRFLVIQNKVIAICKRVPAHLKGDGKNTIEELVYQKNLKNSKRAQFQKPLKLTQPILEQINDQGYTPDQIPKKGQLIFLVQNSNVSTGGDSVDVTDEIPTYYQKIALKAANSASASICGVDMLISSLNKKPSEETYKIVELNFNPALYLHRFPSEGKKRYVEKEVLKALGF